MATTQNTYTGNGSTTDYSITFEYLKDADVKVTLDHVATTAFTFPNATTLRFTTAPGNNVAIRIFRDTDVDAARFIYSAGSSIKAAELNENADQTLYGLQETANTDDITDQAVTTAKLRDGAVTTAKFANLSITTAQLVDSSVTTAKIAADAVNGTKIADNSINSEHYVDGSIDTAHIADAQVTSAKLADNIISNAKMMNNSVNTAEIVNSAVTADKIPDGTILTAKLADSIISNAKMMNNSVDTAEIINNAVTTAKIADSAITNAKLADAELVELATMGGNTASALADLTQAEVQILDGATVTTAELNTLDGVTATATEINQLDGNTLKTSSTDFTSSIQFPSAAQIDARITARIDPLGGFEAIADEDSFPATAPPVGTVISIANANSLAVNSSGVGAGTRAGGSDAVVINGFPSGFNSTSLDDGIGLLVIATSTAHTYDFHRVVAKNEDVRQLSSDINDFKARYRIGSSNPTTDNDAGDLFFNTGTSKMLVRNAGNSAWQEVQAVGDFFINTISSSSGTGGGSATFNGSAYRFTLSNAPITAQQLLVSINGVVQKPNSGTSQPSEGFVLNGADIIFSAAPASGAAGFFITIGSSVGIGTPSDNTVSTAKLVNDSVTNAKIADDSIDSEHYVDGSIDTAHIADSAVTSAKIADGTIVNADVNASAAIAGTKISPNFGSQNVLTTGSVGIGTSSPSKKLHIVPSGSNAYDAVQIGDGLYLGNTSNNNNAALFHQGGGANLEIGSQQHITFTTGNTAGNATERMRIDSSGNVGINQVPTRELSLHSPNNNNALIHFTNDDTGETASDGALVGIDGNEDLNINNQESGKNVIFRNNGERMRIDSSGNVGIGTSTINLTASGRKTLDLNGNSENAISFSHSNTLAAFLYTSSTEFRMQSEISVPLVFKPNNSEVMRLETSGRAKCTAGYLYVQNSASGTGDTDGLALISDGNADKYIWNYENTSLRFGTNSQERMRIEGGGNTRLEIKSGLYLHHLNSGAGNSTLKYGTSSGLVSFDTSSRLVKEQIIDCPYGIDKLKQLQPRKYFRTDDQAVEIGFIADELVQVMPEFVPIGPKSVITKNENDTEEIPLGVNYEKLTSVLTKALQEAIAKIETLETQNASLEARLTILEGAS